jgi:hypothetical protein
VIQLILFVTLGAGFLFSLYLFARRGSHVEGSAQDVFKARQALMALQSGLLPPEMVERIFAKSDYEYVMAGSDHSIRELFLAERRKIALLWVNQIRQQVLNLRQFHLGSARFYSRLSMRTETKLGFEFFTLLCICRTLQIALYLRGPYAAPRMVGRATAAAARVCDISQKSMSFVKAAQLDALGDDSVHKLSVP